MEKENDMLAKEKTGFGPAFKSSRSRLFRSEYALISIAIVAYLIWSYRTGITWIDLVALIFFALLPDLASFIPMGLSSKASMGKGSWPPWGSSLYNGLHTIIVWALVFGVAWVILRDPYLPLLGWLLHITGDRAVGFTLRSKSE